MSTCCHFMSTCCHLAASGYIKYLLLKDKCSLFSALASICRGHVRAKRKSPRIRPAAISLRVSQSRLVSHPFTHHQHLTPPGTHASLARLAMAVPGFAAQPSTRAARRRRSSCVRAPRRTATCVASGPRGPVRPWSICTRVPDMLPHAHTRRPDGGTHVWAGGGSLRSPLARLASARARTAMAACCTRVCTIVCRDARSRRALALAPRARTCSSVPPTRRTTSRRSLHRHHECVQAGSTWGPPFHDASVRRSRQRRTRGPACRPTARGSRAAASAWPSATVRRWWRWWRWCPRRVLPGRVHRAIHTFVCGPPPHVGSLLLHERLLLVPRRCRPLVRGRQPFPAGPAQRL